MSNMETHFVTKHPHHVLRVGVVRISWGGSYQIQDVSAVISSDDTLMVVEKKKKKTVENHQPHSLNHLFKLSVPCIQWDTTT